MRRTEVVLDGVDLTLGSGVTLGLVGPNGSGKSTLLRLLAGVDRPTRGSVEVFGQDLTSRAGLRLRAQLGYLAEDSSFPGELRASAALELLCGLSGDASRERRERARDLLARVGLREFEDRPLRSFSRGMLRRFGLAQAFSSTARLILLDEPTAGLDAPGHRVLDELVREAYTDGKTIVIASHIASDLLDYCDRVALLVGGRLVKEGPLDDVLGRTDSTQLDVSGLDERAIETLTESVRSQGGDVETRRRPRVTLSELYARYEAFEGEAN